MSLEYLGFLALCGGLMGILSGLLGVGGGLLLIPMLLYLPGLFGASFTVSLKLATGYAALQSLSGGGTSALKHFRNNLIHLPYALYMGVFSMVGGYFGAASSPYFETELLRNLLVGFVSFTLISTLYKWWSSSRSNPSNATHEEPLPPTPTTVQALLPPEGLTLPGIVSQLKHIPFIALVLAVVFGFMAGLLGIGGAIFIIPLLEYGLKLSPRHAIGTSAGIVVLCAISTVIGKVQGNLIEFPACLALIGAAMAGGHLGATWSAKLPVGFLRGLFCSVLIVALVRLLWTT